MLVNLIGFNLCWIGLIVLGNSFVPIALIWLSIHIYFCKQRTAEVKLILSITIIGTLIDSLLSFFNVLQFNSDVVDIPFIPIWLMTLWGVFASTIAHSLKPFEHSRKIQWLIGLLLPALSYVAGSKLSSVELGYSLFLTYFIIGSIWSFLLVLFFELKKHFYINEVIHE